MRIVKGAFAVVAAIAEPSPAAAAMVEELQAKGFRVLVVAVGPAEPLRIAGVIALSDPPREDSAALIAQLHGLGVRTVMVTGDAPVTARVVADAVGITGPICATMPLPRDIRAEEFGVFAGVLPEDKYALVQAFQRGGHVVGMCGDGANDAPALRQAQMGIAVFTATDVAKSAAGIVLTEPGLGGIVAAVQEGRTTFQRILTYTLRSIVHKVVQVLFLLAGLVISGTAVLTPLLMVHDDGGRRFLRPVVGDRQCAGIADPQCLADRQSHHRRRHPGILRSRLLYRQSRGRALRPRPRQRDFADADGRYAGVQRPGDFLCLARAPASVEFPARLLADRIVHPRHHAVQHARDPGHPDGAFAGSHRGRAYSARRSCWPSAWTR